MHALSLTFYICGRDRDEREKNTDSASNRNLAAPLEGQAEVETVLLWQRQKKPSCHFVVYVQ